MHNPQPQPPLARCLVWSGYAVFIWSLGYMLPHLYWALGGTAGLTLLKPTILDLAQWELINWVASIFLTGAGCLGLAFIYFPRRRWLGALLLAIAWAGCSLATSHGLYGIVNRGLQMAGLAALEGGPFAWAEHAYVFWDLVLFEPWFLIEGILLAVLGRCYLRQARHRRLWLVACLLGIGFGLITGLMGVRFA